MGQQTGRETEAEARVPRAWDVGPEHPKSGGQGETLGASLRRGLWMKVGVCVPPGMLMGVGWS